MPSFNMWAGGGAAGGAPEARTAGAVLQRAGAVRTGRHSTRSRRWLTSVHSAHSLHYTHFHMFALRTHSPAYSFVLHSSRWGRAHFSMLCIWLLQHLLVIVLNQLIILVAIKTINQIAYRKKSFLFIRSGLSHPSSNSSWHEKWPREWRNWV